MSRTAMIAMGGNSLSPKGEAGTITQQFAHTRETLDGIGNFIERGYNLCINHGNGPQVGNELLRMDLTHDKVPPLPLGVCVAGTQGSIGYMIQQSLQNKLRDMKVDREVVTMVTQVIVDKNDPSIKDPSKYVGARYPENEAKSLAKIFGWSIKEQEPGQWRRVVPSPMPEYIMHGKSIKALVDRGTIVIASGGGGIPVFNDPTGHLEGLDAVIDKDYAAAKLGRILHAEELWIITDVDNVYLSFGTENQEILRIITTSDVEKLYNKGEFQQGSIGPKIKAALHFLKYHGKKVVITSIPCIKDALEGNAGTEIRNEA
ncbi:MAG: carbamate kinase [Candidatus Marinimicrobia bacterium]|nr:carbamate kinase [Candidatus Neomarinimicrobiota bacterium]MBT4828009.1 carbamate kinase [Candidatus Neomarinimicrobiota bacterium]MBT5225778.1 carbamate kinase [Candidatus Neomarinimicrobiota bacterium]MBT7118919.1 carbamate kinase [Candidatus Neomarinimicrobiota bacterium]